MIWTTILLRISKRYKVGSDSQNGAAVRQRISALFVADEWRRYEAQTLDLTDLAGRLRKDHVTEITRSIAFRSDQALLVVAISVLPVSAVEAVGHVQAGQTLHSLVAVKGEVDEP